MQLDSARRALGVLVAVGALTAASFAYATVGVNKSFTPNSVVAGQSSTLTIVLLNPNASAATGVALTDTLPNGVTVANPLNVGTNTCGFSTASIVPGTRPIPLSGGTVPALSGGTPGQCSITIDVVSSTPNTYLNTIAAGSVASSQGTNSQDAQATLVVSSPLPITGSKAFAPTNMHGNGPVSRLTITLTNPNAIALTSAAITDSLPANVTVASGVGEPNPTTSCGGTATASAPATSPATIALSGGTIPASGFCTLAVDVVARNPNALVNGNQTNTIAAGALTTAQGVTSPAITANINVQTGGSLAKAFAPTPIAPNGASTLTFTVTNFNSTVLTGIGFTDNLPGTMTATGVPTTTCNASGPATITTLPAQPAPPPYTSFTVSGGSLAGVVGPAAGSTTCTVTVPVTASATGSNSILAGNYGGVAIGAVGATTLSVSAITGSKTFTTPAIQTGSTTMTITLNNLTGSAANITAFTDLLTTMGAGFTVSGAVTNTCGITTFVAPVGGTSITVSPASGTIPANGSCTITVPIAISAVAATGNRTNTIAANGIHTSIGNNTVAITGVVNVQRALTMSKAFNPATVQGGAVSRLTVTLAPTVNLAGVGFTDDLTTMGAGFVIASVPNGVATNCGTVFAPVAGATSFAIAGGSLTAGTNCTVAVNIATPASTGVFQNHIPAANFVTTQGVTTADTNANLTLVNNSVTVNKSFSPTTVAVGNTTAGNPNFSTLSIQIRNNNAGAIALTGVALSDALPQVGAQGMVVANPATASFTGAGCSAAVITAPVGATSISMIGANVNANSTCTLAVRVVGTISGNLINTVNAGAVTSTQGVSNPLQGTATLAVTGTVNLTVTKTDGVISAIPGANTTYTITVSNAGPNSVTGLGVNDTPPAGMTFTSWTCAATAGSNCPASGSGPIAATVSILNAGSVTFTVTAAIASSATGSIANTVSLAVPGSVIDTNPVTSATDTDTLTPQADLSISKTDGAVNAVPGTPITYTIVATNNGPSDAPGANVVDSFPAAITSASWTCVATLGSACPASGSGNINAIVNLLAGGSATFTVTGTISSTALGTLSNTATIAAPAGVTDPNPANNSATDTDGLTPQADLAITKTDGVTSVNAGGSTTYTIVASNNGPSAVTGATVTDNAPANMTFGSWACVASVGSSCPPSGSGNISASVNLLVGGTATFTVPATVAGGASGSISNTATIGVPAGVTDLVPGNNAATDTDTITPVADLSISKTDGTTTATPGGQTTYTITVHNNGPSGGAGATVGDLMPAAITSDTFTATQSGGASGFSASGSGNIADTVNMPSGSTITYTVVANINASATGSMSNTATVAVPSGVVDSNPANNSSTDTDTLTPQVDLSITKTDGVTSVVAGASTTYTIVVHNNGPSNVTGASVTDPLPATITSDTFTATQSGGASGFTASGSGNISDTVNMPSGSTITYTVVANVGAGATGSISNTATVTAPAGVTDTNPANNSATDTDTVALQADLSITKDDGKTSVVPGTSTTYTIAVHNNGPSNVTGASVSDVMPAAIASDTFTATQSGGANGFSASGSGNIADTVNMPSGSTVTYTVVANVSPSATGSISNTATVAVPSGVTDTNSANNSATDTDSLTPQADLSITKDDGKTSINAGASTVYTIVVTNNGPSAANNAVFTDPAVTNLNVTGVSCASASGGAACPASTTVALMQGAGIVIQTLPSGGGVTFTVNATVAGGATGTIANTATIAAPAGVTDPTPGNNSATDTDTINLVADLSITKTDGVTSVNAGASTVYTIVVTNNGPSSADGAVFTDPAVTNLGATGVTCGSPTGSAICSSVPNTTVALMQGAGIVIPTLPSSGSVTFTVNATVAGSATGTIANTASIATPAAVSDPTPGNNSATDSDTVNLVADLSITKTDGATSAVPGAPTTYTIVVSNAGPSNVTGATVTDTMPAEVTSDSFTATQSGGASGFTASGTGNINDTVNMPTGSTITYTVVANIDSSATGTLTNTATVAAPPSVTDPNPANNSATDSDTLAPQVALVVKKTDGSTSYTPGGTATYTVTITDNGPSDAANVTITDTFPAGLMLSADASCVANGNADCGTVTGTLGQTSFGSTGARLGAGAGDSLVFSAPVTFASSMTTPTVANTATATDLVTSNTASDTDTDTLAPDVSLSVFKTDGSTTYTPGGTATYTVTITDTGVSDATNVTITDPLPAGVTLSANASCAANGTANCGAITGTTGQSSFGTTGANIPVGAGNSIVFTAPVAFAPAMTIDPLDNKADATDLLSGATGSSTDRDALALGVSLAVSKTDNSPTYVPGGVATYTITVTNTGLSDATSVTVTDTLPGGVTLTGNASCTPNGTAACGTVTGTTGQSTLGSTGAHIPAGAGNSLVFTAPVAFAANMLADPLINSATANDGPSGASGSGSDSDGRGATADLAITKSDGVTSAVPGQSVTYTIAVTNSGPSDVTGATVTDTLPAAIASATWTCLASGGGTCTASGAGSIGDTVNLPVGATLTYTLVASIAPGAIATLANTATVTPPASVTDPNPGNNSATDSDTLMPQADLSITKTDGVTTVNPGQAVIYTIVATNNGPSAVTGAVVTDALPASLIGAAWTCAASAGSGCPGSGSGNINAAVNLIVGGTATFTLSATVSGTASGSISNTATVTAPAGVTDTDPSNNSATDTDTVVIILLPDLTLTKVHNGGNFAAGQVGASYTITVRNLGSAPTSGTVTVVDALPSALTATAMAGSGWSCTVGTLTCTRGDALPPATSYPAITLTVNVASTASGSLVNNVTVSGGGDANGGNNSASDSVTIVPARLAPVSVPALNWLLLWLLALLVAGAGLRLRRR